MGKAKSLFATNGKFDWVKFTLGLFTLLFVLGLAYISWLVYFEDNPPAEILEATVTPAVVEPGGEIYYTLDWCKYTEALADVRMVWKNDLVYIVPAPDPFYIPPGCHVTSLLGSVPESLESGEYIIEVEVIYQVNHFAERMTEFEMGPIVVVAEHS
jgi:hypothetical protein